MVGPSVLMQALFDAKSGELSSMFRGHDDPLLFRNLKYLDPGHTNLYNEAEEAR